MTLNEKTYEFFKWLVQIVLPACAALYAALAALWSFPFAEAIVGTISAIAVFLGTIMKISNSNYEGAGTLMVDTSQEGDNQYRLDLNTDFSDLAEKKQFVVKVNNTADLSASQE